MSLLEIKDMTYGVKDKEIFSGFSLSLKPREVHAILGTNGSGKSTLAYLVMGCEGYVPTSGGILFKGKSINKLKLHERARLGITLAWQEPVRLEGISVRDYLTLKDREADPSKYLEMVGLTPELYLNRMMDRTLSGGERKRIELASIIALEPELAILDEPDSGIDMLSIQGFINQRNVMFARAERVCMHQLEELMRSFGESGGDRSILANKDIAHLVAGGHRILSMRAVEGLEVKAKETVKGITAHVRVTAAIKNPVHLCFGILHKKGIQEIKMDIVFEAGASASFIAHCIFPKAEKVRHIMDASIRIGENAQMRYSEIHYHGPFGGIEVIPKAHVIVGKNGRFSADFSLVNGRVGKLWIDYA
ncbi:MAG: ATP-binding cassette domain-containing protein, partial [Candidatus Methanoperedens sp.]|nr:ATP-binding cassette domain-containing protein [Candidatus Methanoperedens sp.]